MTLPPFRLRRRPCAADGEILGRAGKETLRFPLPTPARLAVIDAEFHIGANMRAFKAGDTSGLIDYAPEALALPLDGALSMADRKLRGIFDLPSLKFAIVVLSSLGVPDATPLSGHHRDLLWKAFGLPVFEQLRGWDGRVFARECEVHDGLHFVAGTATTEIDGEELTVTGLPTGLSAEIVRQQCECGMETPRLRCLSALVVRNVAASSRAAAA